jgi:hypothetical protein
MPLTITIEKSFNPKKKYMAQVNNKTIHFGATGYEDMTTHGDEQRNQKYLQRHRKNEDWSKDNIASSGYMSRWLLWNKKTLQASIDDVNKKYKNIKFQLKK